MNLDAKLSYAAKKALSENISLTNSNESKCIKEKMWKNCYNTYLSRAPTQGGAEEWATEKADRFWPLYKEIH